MEIGIRIEAENMRSGERRHTNSCYMTYVAIDGAGRPLEVPLLVTETPEEQRRLAASTARRQLRLGERDREKHRGGSAA